MNIELGLYGQDKVATALASTPKIQSNHRFAFSVCVCLVHCKRNSLAATWLKARDLPTSSNKHMLHGHKFVYMYTYTVCVCASLHVYVLRTMSRNDRYMYLHLEANTNYPAFVRSSLCLSLPLSNSGSVYLSTFTLAV